MNAMHTIQSAELIKNYFIHETQMHEFVHKLK
jgi:hypothetical protein